MHQATWRSSLPNAVDQRGLIGIGRVTRQHRGYQCEVNSRHVLWDLRRIGYYPELQIWSKLACPVDQRHRGIDPGDIAITVGVQFYD